MIIIKCRHRMIVMMFIGMDVAPNIVRKNAHKTGNCFYHKEPWKSASYHGLDLMLVIQVVRLRSVVRYHPSLQYYYFL